MNKVIKIFGNLSYNVAERIVKGFIKTNEFYNSYSDTRCFGKVVVVETEKNYIVCKIDKK